MTSMDHENEKMTSLEVFRNLMEYKKSIKQDSLKLAISNLMKEMEKSQEFGKTKNLEGIERPLFLSDIQNMSKPLRKVEKKSRFEGIKRQMKDMRVVKKVTAHRSSVYCVKKSIKGDLIITGSDDYLIKSFKATSLELKLSYRGHRNCIVDILTVMSSSGKEVLVSSSVDTEIRVWELYTGKCLIVIQWHTAACGPMCFGEGTLVTTSDDGMACLWALDALIANNTEISLDDHDTDPIFSVKKLTNKRNNGAHIPIVLPHLKDRVKVNVNCVAMHKSKKFIATGADDGVGRIWSIPTIENKKCRNTPNAETIENQLLSSRDYLDGSTRLCTSLKAHNASITNILWSNRGDRLLTSSVKDGSVKIWYWGTGSFFTTAQLITLHAVPVSSSSLLHRSTTVVSETALINLISPLLREISLNPETFNLEKYLVELERPDEEVNQLKSLLMTRSFVKEKKATIDAATWTSDDRRIVTMQSTPTKLSENGNSLDSSGFSDQVLKVWDSRTGELLFKKRKHRRPSYCVLAHPVFSNIVVTLGHDSQICYWDVVEKKLVKSLMVSAMFGPCSLLDGLFTSNVDLLATDSYGRLVVVGSPHDCVRFKYTFSEQFFKNEYTPLEYDGRGFCVDTVTRLEPHVSPLGPLTNTHLDPYSRPLDSQLVRYLDSTTEQREHNAMLAIEDTLKSMDLLISLASKCDEFEDLKVINYPVLFKNIIVNNSRLERNNATLLAPTEPFMEDIEPITEENEPNYEENEVRRSERQRNRSGIPSFRALAEGRIEEASERQAPRRRAARRAGERIRYFRNLTASSNVQNSPVMMPIESDSEFSESSIEVVDDPEQILRMNRRRRRLRRSSRARRRVETSDEQDEPSDEVNEQNEVPSRDRLAELLETRGYLAEMKREWLQEESLNHAFGNYVPQVRDEVVFSVQGFEEYVNQYYPGQVLSYLGAASEFPYVLTRITSIKYEFPRTRGTLDSIVATIHLELLATPLQQTSSTRFWNPVDTREGFELSLVSHDCSDFLILKQMFEESLKLTWQRRDPIKCYYLTEERVLDFDLGWIKLVDTLDEAKWPNSKWKCLLIAWNDGSNDMRVSPWEIERPGEDMETLIRSQVCLSETNKTKLKELFTEVQTSQPFAAPFSEKVDTIVYTDYNILVPVAIDLDLITKRLENDFYRSVESLKFDVELLYENCLNYNLPDSEIAQSAGVLRNYLLKGIKKATRRQMRGGTPTVRIEVPQAEEEEEEKEEQEVSTRGRKRRRVKYVESEEEEEEVVRRSRNTGRTRRRLPFSSSSSDFVRRSTRSTRTSVPNYHVPDEFDEDIAERENEDEGERVRRREEEVVPEEFLRRSSRTRSSRVSYV